MNEFRVPALAGDHAPFSSENAGKIPATIITGFLGAGKTSLVRHLLENAAGRRIALIINEFGDLGVDGEVLKSCGSSVCREDDIVELANGCICCTVADDFLPTIEALLARVPCPEHIVIETSGLALPKPLVQAFAWPEVRTRVTVDGVVAVVDAPAVAAGQFASDPGAVDEQRRLDPSLDHESPLEELFTDQLACADLVVVNKSDLVDQNQRSAIEAAITKNLRPAVKIAMTRHGAIDPSVLLGIDAAAENDLASRPSHTDDEGDHEHDEFDSFVVDLAPVRSADGLTDRLRRIMAEHQILRLKGFVAVDRKDMRLLVQAVGDRVQHYFDRAWRDGEPRHGRLVVIGFAGLDRVGITQAICAR